MTDDSASGPSGSIQLPERWDPVIEGLVERGASRAKAKQLAEELDWREYGIRMLGERKDALAQRARRELESGDPEAVDGPTLPPSNPGPGIRIIHLGQVALTTGVYPDPRLDFLSLAILGHIGYPFLFLLLLVFFFHLVLAASMCRSDNSQRSNFLLAFTR